MSGTDRRPPPHSVQGVSARQLRAYRRAARRPPIERQVDRLLDDRRRLDLLGRDGEPDLRHGAALAVAQAALELAVTAAADDDERALRRSTLLAVRPVLEAAGHGHVGALIDAALAHDTDPATLSKGSQARH